MWGTTVKPHGKTSHDLKSKNLQNLASLHGRQRRRIKHGRRRLHTRHVPLLGLICCRRLRRSVARQLDGRPHVMSALTADILSCLFHEFQQVVDSDTTRDELGVTHDSSQTVND